MSWCTQTAWGQFGCWSDGWLPLHSINAKLLKLYVCLENDPKQIQKSWDDQQVEGDSDVCSIEKTEKEYGENWYIGKHAEEMLLLKHQQELNQKRNYANCQDNSKRLALVGYGRWLWEEFTEIARIADSAIGDDWLGFKFIL